MSAHNHIHLTTKITLDISRDSIPDDNLISLLPKVYRDDFEYISKEDFIRTSPKFSDGTVMEFKKTFIEYSLKKEYLEKIHSFIYKSLELAHEILYKEDDNNPYKKVLDEFIDEFKIFEIDTLALYNGDSKKLEKLEDIESNYFTKYVNIPSQVVYDGFPDELESNNRSYSLLGFDIIHSFSKLGENRDDIILFDKLKEKLQNEIAYFPLNKYIYHLDY